MSLVEDIFDVLSDSDSPVTDDQVKRMQDMLGLDSIDGSIKIKDLRFIRSGAPIGNRNAAKDHLNQWKAVGINGVNKELVNRATNAIQSLPENLKEELKDTKVEVHPIVLDRHGNKCAAIHDQLEKRIRVTNADDDIEHHVLHELGHRYDKIHKWQPGISSLDSMIKDRDSINYGSQKESAAHYLSGASESFAEGFAHAYGNHKYAFGMQNEEGRSVFKNTIEKVKELTSGKISTPIKSSFEGHAGRIGQVGGSVSKETPRDATSENPHIKAGRFLMEVQNPDAQDTEQAYKKDGQWTQERVDKVHVPALARIREGIAKATGKPTVYMTGGGTASGKSTLLQKFPKLVGFPTQGHAIVADPDEMKKACPEYQRCANPNSEHFFNGAASLVHEESSYLGKKAVTDGIKDGYNVVYDTTGDSGITKLEQKVAQMREAGAGRVDGHYAFPGSVEEAYRRSMERFDHAKDGLKRYVDPEVIKASHHDVAGTWMNAARKGTFDKLTIWSTAVEKGQPPVEIAEAEGGKIKVHNEDLFNKFRLVGGI